VNKKALVILFTLLISAAAGYGQTNEETIFDEATIIYKRSVYGGITLHTNGWGAHLTFGKSKTAFKSRILQFEVVGMKHIKEVRSFNPYYDDSRSYVFGKLNTLTVFRPTIGMRYVKFDKIRKSGVAIGYNWRVGPAIGLVKPVYLEIGQPETPPYQRIVVEKYDPEIHTVEEIFGRASFLKGLNELGINPGIHASFGLNFEYDPERSGLKGIEVGVNVDYYPLNEVEIMAFTDNYNLFVNFYVTLQFGKKFNN